MDYRLELIAVPVSDVDRAKAFYVEQAGFNADHDHTVSEEIRFVQLTPPGSACSITIGKGVTTAEPGSASLIPVPMAIEQADPGGVSWTKRMSSLTTWSWSALKPACST